MILKFSSTFKENLKHIYWQQTWIYKVYSFFKIDLWQFLANIYRFRKVLWQHRWWDYHYTLEALKTSLQIMEKGLSERGIEETTSRLKKIEKIRRAIKIIDNKNNFDFVERAEAELGLMVERNWEWEDFSDGTYTLIDNFTDEEKKHNNIVYARANEIEVGEWKELWQILEGQDHTKYKESGMEWEDWFDGTGMGSWWD